MLYSCKREGREVDKPKYIRQLIAITYRTLRTGFKVFDSALAAIISEFEDQVTLSPYLSRTITAQLKLGSELHVERLLPPGTTRRLGRYNTTGGLIGGGQMYTVKTLLPSLNSIFP